MYQNKSKLLAVAFLFFISESLAASSKALYEKEPKGFPSSPQYIPPAETSLAKEVRKEEEPKSVAGVKSLIAYKLGDMNLLFGGSAKFEHFFAKNVVLLNNKIPDEFGFFKNTIDIAANLSYGKEKYGHKAVELFANLRQKALWGNVGRDVATVSETVKLDGIDAVIGGHKHLGNKSYIWLRDIWMQVSLNALFEKTTENLHFIKIGMFPFYVGRGIALGPVYGASKDFLGIYTGYQSDQLPPAINVRGEVIKDMLKYDFYFAKLEEKSGDFADTFNHVKSNHVGRRATPWRGVSKDNDLFVSRLLWTPLRNDQQLGTIDVEPYFIFNEASDRKLAFEGDNKTELMTVGIGVEWKKGNFDWGFEGAFNFGQEIVFNIDRNIIELSRDSSGNIITVFSHVVDDSGNKVTVTSARKTVVSSSNNITNGAAFGADGGVTLKNASNRFRPEYQNAFRGRMFVGDIAYKVEKSNMKVATAYGYASGDENPNTVESNKTYKGFIGLQEGYAGKRVPSVFVLDARKVKRPLPINTQTDAEGDTGRSPGDDSTFTDMHYFGGGFKWFPIDSNESKFYLNANLLSFWTASRHNKFDSAQQVTTTEKASSHLGIETNLRVKYETFKDLYVYGDLAIFFPGRFYRDVGGTPLSSDVFNRLDLTDKTGIDSNNYRLSHNIAYLFNIGTSYKF